MATGGGRRFEAARHPTLHPLKNRAVSGFSVRRWRSSRLFFLTVSQTGGFAKPIGIVFSGRQTASALTREPPELSMGQTMREDKNEES
jgi:hypothetical protein